MASAHRRTAMKYHLPLISVAALALLSACNKNDEPEVVGGPADPMAEQPANAAPIALPPMVKESHQYRCKDKRLISVARSEARRVEKLCDTTRRPRLSH